MVSSYLTEAGQYDGAAGLASSILNRAPALARQVEQGRLLEAMAHGAVEGQVTPNPQRR